MAATMEPLRTKSLVMESKCKKFGNEGRRVLLSNNSTVQGLKQSVKSGTGVLANLQCRSGVHDIEDQRKKNLVLGTDSVTQLRRKEIETLQSSDLD